ncbi:ATP-dependent DNA ligase [Rhodococcus ruber]|uniref:DNA ligase (ATP) n=1 Tax=Rhodococcus ruber TaxID=1830 RepID=A0ABT4MA20_9NOCA|nr:ATP-dependent DNA ligase [Rhodococcus ruber]MCZ4517564.1 ATP-dependent DNA ligase [Rhodococcus ruber]
MATLEIEGRKVSVTNLDKVLFPDTGTTKGNIIEYYVAIAPAMLPLVVGRAVTRKRWPNGVDQSSFFEKNLAASAPDWLDRRSMQHSDRVVTYPLFSTAADLAWLGQQAAIEAHVPQWRFDGTEPGPATRMVFDLDPGDDVDLARCAEVACEIRDLIGDIGMTAYPVTSGSKGIHLYVPLEKPLSTSGASTVAKRVATLLEERSPDRVTATMAKAKRTGRVFVDWSQNNGKKTTVAPYSLRGRTLPTVAAPRTWDELEASGLQQLRFEEVLERFQDLGDLLAPLDPTVDWAPESSPATDKLDKYRSMRSADKTPEPIPTTTEPQGNNDTFVIQEHRARRLHYDFRLEHDGVLVSWAVPKNIPVDTKQNRLAVHTEDHPLEYATFSGRIPKGEYGGGDVTIWDSGTYELEKWREDEVIVVLNGSKARGRFALIRTKGNQWLMHLMKDATSDKAVSDNPPPKNISPMLATAGDILGLGDDEWSFEGKWDGFRIVAEFTHGSMTLRSRSGNDYTEKFGALQSLADDLSDHDAVVDGEVVVFDANGISSFEMLQNATRDDIRFIAFDLLYLDGTSLLRKKYSDRRRLLELLTTGLDSVLVPPRLTGSAEDAVAESRERGWEGVIAKRTDSVYQPGKRAHTWIKYKNWRTQEVVIGGWRRGQGRRAGGFGSLLMGIPDGDGLRYVGRVGTGFDDRALDTLAALLAPLETSDSPFSAVLPTADRNGAVWVEPTLVGEVRFYESTESGHLRHPSWRGLRPDKAPEDVVPE